MIIYPPADWPNRKSPRLICRHCGKSRLVFIVRNADGSPATLVPDQCDNRKCIETEAEEYATRPDTPGELTRADRDWIKKHTELVCEWAAAEHQLIREVWGH